ncbi:hypothetical protein EJ06DRAFT_16115 [Trichodelitschia bisporula]|uniref:Cyclin N-terminal domain-containing protein n=1 Tax=Trichodelitschia bisporula TaxID=703511 RepID=A0A6G1IAG8_9PEZI|nr:hypothetical protein EJ06DRAFT_16115 [Trichodelitschia bisporula]
MAPGPGDQQADQCAFVAIMVHAMRLYGSKPQSGGPAHWREPKSRHNSCRHLSLHEYCAIPMPASSHDSRLVSQTLTLAALSLASKPTECPRHISELVPVALALRRWSSNEADELHQAVLRAEIVLLKILSFDVRFSSPLSFISDYLRHATTYRRCLDIPNFDRLGTTGKLEYGIVDEDATPLAQLP